jgi:hypothetical protein
MKTEDEVKRVFDRMDRMERIEVTQEESGS